MNSYTPDPIADIKRFEKFIMNKTPFVFIRFSDGETEVLKRRKLVLGQEGIEFRGNFINKIYPSYDQKSFDPDKHAIISDDLHSSLNHYHDFYFKGIPSGHNVDTNDKEYYISLLDKVNNNITFADLFVNSNYRAFLKNIVPKILECENVYLVGNHRSRISNSFSGLFSCPDNFFAHYDTLLSECKLFIDSLPANSYVLSSCSSLSNILGHYVSTQRNDITFLDVGSAINHLIGLDKGTRVYHDYVFGPRSIKSTIQLARHLFSGKMKLKWK